MKIPSERIIKDILDDREMKYEPCKVELTLPEILALQIAVEAAYTFGLVDMFAIEANCQGLLLHMVSGMAKINDVAVDLLDDPDDLKVKAGALFSSIEQARSHWREAA